jgi:glycogen operon protein
VSFALWSPGAEGVEVCLAADPQAGTGPEVRVALEPARDGIWRGRVAGLGPGALYGFRVHGPWDPERGLRFNPAKLLLDPRARAVAGRLDWQGPVHGHRPDAPELDLAQDHRDSAPFVPWSVVVDPVFDWGDDRPPLTPWEDTVVYEVHVRGFTMRHPGVAPGLRGTYAGLASAAALEHLTALGVTAVELLPVHHALTEEALARRGLVNYWGYNPIAWFAPEARYSASGDRGGQVGEF